MTDVEFNPEAKDGDGDGIIQEGTPFERPIEEAEVNPVADEAPEAEPVLVADEPEEAPAPEAAVITGVSTGGSNEEQVLAPVEDGVIGTATQKKAAKKPAPKKQAEPAAETVAIFADRNLVWQGVGKIVKGYNIVSKTAAQQWLTLDGVREASPTEIKTNLG